MPASEACRARVRVRWKGDNLAKLSEGRREKLLSGLRRVLTT
ncbi:hypothetical protein GGD50_005804 [Rhizobium paranaense]|uniref:Uncharacterized protein n=1 Tax=Rhizobium paranaense TaxID=1650438 RepID=A0A7W8XX25_9HYPH|nr:hypothetical protein [Rhizobium paranaense]